MSHGKKRSSPGASEEKSPFADVDVSPEEAKTLEGLTKERDRVELSLERDAQKKLVAVYEKRRPILKAIDKFWPVALRNEHKVAVFSELPKDQQALAYLEDVWVVRDPNEFRVFTIEFTFKTNPFFKDTLLKKVYKYSPGADSKNDSPDANGITDAMVDFSWERDVEGQPTTIQWTDDAHNLGKLYPRKTSGEGDEEDIEDTGSFFNWFEVGPDTFDLGIIIADEVYPEAIDFFLGKKEDEELDIDEDEDSMDEDDDDNAEEIDLEKPRSKKQKHT